MALEQDSTEKESSVKLSGLAAVGIHAELLRHRMERAEEGERELLTIIGMFADGSKVAEAYLKGIGKQMNEREVL
jgi:post-segregation antitoxin (ccd killing protein)